MRRLKQVFQPVCSLPAGCGRVQCYSSLSVVLQTLKLALGLSDHLRDDLCKRLDLVNQALRLSGRKRSSVDVTVDDRDSQGSGPESFD